jgi:hypothetical protein
MQAGPNAICLRAPRVAHFLNKGGGQIVLLRFDCKCYKADCYIHAWLVKNRDEFGKTTLMSARYGIGLFMAATYFPRTVNLRSQIQDLKSEL